MEFIRVREMDLPRISWSDILIRENIKNTSTILKMERVRSSSHKFLKKLIYLS